MASSISSLSNLLILCISCFPFFAKSLVPRNETFKYVNEGDFGDYSPDDNQTYIYSVEYDAYYRTLPLISSPFQLCFYNTTPYSYTLALRMGSFITRWVWEANRGKPVGEKATLTFGQDGNLVLANATGKIAWQTNTANKGVVGFRLMPNGNMVLYDSKGIFIWQSFDYPTDTLLFGQSLKLPGPTTLVSRVSTVDNRNGPYSFVFSLKGFSLYFQGPNAPKPFAYYDSEYKFGTDDDLASQNMTMTFIDDVQEGYTYLVLQLDTRLPIIAGKTRTPNVTLSILRLDFDGNLRIYTYYKLAWEVNFILFDRGNNFRWDRECQLPSRCGKFGVCKDNQCVACPSPKGLLGYSEKCQPPKLPSCATKDITYYKIEGVLSFRNNKYDDGETIKMGACKSKCTKDCKCLGYFYNTESSQCWIAYDLMTLTKVDTSTDLGFIKTPKL